MDKPEIGWDGQVLGQGRREIVPAMAASVTVPPPFSASAVEEVCKVLVS
jgi:hypothetical protein